MNKNQTAVKRSKNNSNKQLQGLYEEKKCNREAVTSSKLGNVESQQLEAVQKKKIQLEAICKLVQNQQQGDKTVDLTASSTSPVPNVSVPQVITQKHHHLPATLMAAAL